MANVEGEGGEYECQAPECAHSTLTRMPTINGCRQITKAASNRYCKATALLHIERHREFEAITGLFKVRGDLVLGDRQTTISERRGAGAKQGAAATGKGKRGRPRGSGKKKESTTDTIPSTELINGHIA